MMTSSHLQYHIRHIYLSEAHRVGFDPFDGDNNYDNDDIFPLCLNEATHRVDFYQVQRGNLEEKREMMANVKQKQKKVKLYDEEGN